jgi:hypothetical protein
MLGGNDEETESINNNNNRASGGVSNATAVEHEAIDHIVQYIIDATM